MSATARHVALYCRLSPRPDGSYEGVEVQERSGRRYAKRAWPGVPIVVYSDKGISAANGDHRPKFEELRQAIRGGEVAHLWSVEQSRLERREVGWLELAAELDAAGISEVDTDRDGMVRVTDEVAGIKAVLAAAEVRELTKRVNDRLADNAAGGWATGSLPFGYAHGTEMADGKVRKVYEIAPEEAEAIEFAAEQILAGWSQSAVAAELRKRGYQGNHNIRVRDGDGNVLLDEDGQPVTRRTALTAGWVKSMLTNPTVAGMRVHKGEIVGRGNREPILNEVTWQACRSRLNGKRTVTRTDGGSYDIGTAHTSGRTGRKYLLTGGLAVCGVCGHPMTGTVKQLKGGAARGGRDMPYLICHPTAGGNACVSIMLDCTEREVENQLFERLASREFIEMVAADEHAGRRDALTTCLSAIDGQRKDMAAMWGRGELNTEEWQAAKGALDETETSLREELTACAPPPARATIYAAVASWPELELGERRDFLRLYVGQVTISRATPGLRQFDPGRIEVTWKHAFFV